MSRKHNFWFHLSNAAMALMSEFHFVKLKSSTQVNTLESGMKVWNEVKLIVWERANIKKDFAKIRNSPTVSLLLVLVKKNKPKSSSAWSWQCMKEPYNYKVQTWLENNLQRKQIWQFRFHLLVHQSQCKMFLLWVTLCRMVQWPHSRTITIITYSHNFYFLNVKMLQNP